jgi:two-component system, NtrC family, sensor histidine kinase HydH
MMPPMATTPPPAGPERGPFDPPRWVAALGLACVLERGPFDPLRWFAALGLACVLLSAGGTAFFLARFLTGHMLQRDAEVSREFVASTVRAERTWSYFSDPASTASRAPLERFFRHVSELPDVVRANVYDARGTVLWSSSPALVGRRFGGNEGLEGALRGGVVVEWGTAPKEEHVAMDADAGGRRFTETYLPVWDEARREVVGVVEIYRLPDALFRAIDEGVRLIWTAAGLGAALLYGALAWVAARSRCVIARQQARIAEAEALAAVGAVASAVAHGIRNPLASIRSSAELAAVEEDPARARECLADIQREADRVERWVRDLLLQARCEATAPGAVDVAPLLEEAARGVAPAAQRLGVTVALDAPAGLPCVHADAGALGQAIENLVANGVEAMPGGGALRLSAAPTPDGRAVELRVEDTGPGLPARARGGGGLFFSTKPRGTGLGLVLTRRIVERHGGALRLGPGPGGAGTRAVVRLPAAADARAPAPAPAPPRGRAA